MTFESAVEFILDMEGGYSNNSQDPGGETNFGISKRSYPNVDIKNLTRAKAIEIYRMDFWFRCRCGEFPDGVDLILFDSAVNQGPATAIKLLQAALRVDQDGVIGPATIKAAGIFDVRKEFLARRMFQYAINPNIHHFGLGWYRRLADLAGKVF